VQWCHLNPFRTSKLTGGDLNRCFGAFRLELHISPGFRAQQSSAQTVFDGGGSYEELRKAIVEDFSGEPRQCDLKGLNTSRGLTSEKDAKSDAMHVAAWLTKIEPGAIVPMRHSYDAPFLMPKYLRKLEAGSYPKGGVYALVQVIEKPLIEKPRGNAPLGAAKIPEIHANWNHFFEKINPLRMGLLSDLSYGSKNLATQEPGGAGKDLLSVIQSTFMIMITEEVGRTHEAGQMVGLLGTRTWTDHGSGALRLQRQFLRTARGRLAEAAPHADGHAACIDGEKGETSLESRFPACRIQR